MKRSASHKKGINAVAWFSGLSTGGRISVPAPQQKTPRYNVYCIECDFNENFATLVEVGRIRYEHNQGPHEVACYDMAGDRMVGDGEMSVAFEESLPEVQ